MNETIPRSHKAKVAAVRAKIQLCRVYSLGNEFSGAPVTNLEWVWGQYLNHGRGKLINRGDKGYRIDVHANLWYDLS